MSKEQSIKPCALPSSSNKLSTPGLIAYFDLLMRTMPIKDKLADMWLYCLVESSHGQYVFRRLWLSAPPRRPRSSMDKGSDWYHFLSCLFHIHDTLAYRISRGQSRIANDPQFHQRTKHIALRQRFISDMVEEGLIRVQYVPTTDMLADLFTKALRCDRHVAHWGRFHLHPTDLQLLNQLPMFSWWPHPTTFHQKTQVVLLYV